MNIAENKLLFSSCFVPVFDSWVWVDNNDPITQNDYYNFVLPVGEQNCAMMNENSNWTDYNCNNDRGYVCEVAGI